MKLSTGKMAFPIEFDNGETAKIYFNPYDKGIQERISNFENSINQKIKQIDIEKYKPKFDDGINLNIDFENPESLLELSPEEIQSLKNKIDATSEIEKEFNNAVKKEIDVVFASNVSETLFKYCEPFDVVAVEDKNGEEKRELYVLHAMTWLMGEMSKFAQQNKSAVDKHISKYAK